MQKHVTLFVKGLLVLCAVCMGLALPSGVLQPGQDFALGAAWADDDDDDGGDDDDDDDGGGGGGGAGIGNSSGDLDDSRARQPRRTEGRTQRRAAQPLPRLDLPEFAAAEIVVTDLVDADLAVLTGEGFTLIEQLALAELGVSFTRLAIPAALTLDQARTRVRAAPSGTDADFNHYYRTEQAETTPVATAPPACAHENCAAYALVGWDTGLLTAAPCRVSVPVGVIDTGVNAEHDTLQGADIQVIRLAPADADPSRAVHGTAVVSLLVGQRESRVEGLIPEAEVVAVDVFTRVGGDERTDVTSLVQGLDALSSRDIRVINLSLSGPPNTVIARMLDRVTAPDGLDAVVIAAVGNNGPTAAPAYPAAHPAVLAVTAIDGRGRAYGDAQRGPHLDLAAPGVNLLLATSVKGARAQTGTSFAAPFVTAAVARQMSRDPSATGAAVMDALRTTATDIGATGRDDLFGHGILSAGGLCAPPFIAP